MDPNFPLLALLALSTVLSVSLTFAFDKQKTDRSSEVALNLYLPAPHPSPRQISWAVHR